METVLSTKEIMQILPHAYPMLMVDKIVEFEAGEKIVGLKNVTANEPFFQGHFPDNPIMPGVLMVEGMAQAAGLFAYLNSKENGNSNLGLFRSIEKAKFMSQVVPGDTLFFEMKFEYQKRVLHFFSGEAYVKDGNKKRIAVKANLSFAIQ